MTVQGGTPARQGGAAAVSPDERQANAEKRSAAANSVLAAIFLTAMKLVVGILTGSLGILAEAAHSGLDLVAAVVTYLAVRLSGRPPDEEYTYGRGKVENLSALVETVLLVVTCAWIIYEAIQRLFFEEVEVEATFWAFAVMAISIVVDVTRSRMLYAAARKHDSQALEADALHFSTDVWSSSVVILGLAFVWLGQHWLPQYSAVLTKFDAVAALGVAFIVLFVSYELGRRTIDVLLDRAPVGLPQRIEQSVNGMDGVMGVERVRVRRSGARVFVDLIVSVDRNLTFEQTHAIAEAVEARLIALAPGADVVVHADPREREREALTARIRVIAAHLGVAVHNIAMHDLGGQLFVEMHIEVDDELSLSEAHDIATHLEEEMRRDIPTIARVTTHIESRGTVVVGGNDVTESEAEMVAKVARAADAVAGKGAAHDIELRRVADGYALTLHCAFDDALPIRQVHEMSTEMELHLRETLPQLQRVIIHAEPRGDSPQVRLATGR